MSEASGEKAAIVLNSELAQRVLGSAAAEGAIDSDVETFLREIIAGKSKRQIQSVLGGELYEHTKSRVISYAQRGGR